MKLLKFSIIGFFLIIFLNTTNAQSNRDWWNSLSPAWKSVFQEQELKGKNVTPNDEQLVRIIRITHIDCSYNKDVKNLKPLSKLSLLEEIRCESTTIESLEGIENLANLKVIDCSDNDNINSLIPLTNNMNLEEIDCSNTMVKSLSPLVYLKKLKKLDIHFCTINKLTEIGNLKSLEILDVSQNRPLYDINGIEGLTNLVDFNMSETRVKNLSPLKKLKNLKVLNLSNTPVETLREIQDLTELTELDFSKTQVCSASLDYLYGHMSYKMLKARNINVMQDDIDTFTSFYKQKNPNVILIITVKK